MASSSYWLFCFIKFSNLAAFIGCGRHKTAAGEMATTLCKDLVFLILQFFEEEGFKESAHT